MPLAPDEGFEITCRKPRWPFPPSLGCTGPADWWADDNFTTSPYRCGVCALILMMSHFKVLSVTDFVVMSVVDWSFFYHKSTSLHVIRREVWRSYSTRQGRRTYLAPIDSSCNTPALTISLVVRRRLLFIRKRSMLRFLILRNRWQNAAVTPTQSDTGRSTRRCMYMYTLHVCSPYCTCICIPILSTGCRILQIKSIQWQAFMWLHYCHLWHKCMLGWLQFHVID